MKPQSAGTLLFRRREGILEVLLVHPSGNYNRHRPWSIPKGLPEADEDLEAAARRETEEETGLTAGELFPLGYVDYTKSRKRIHAFGGEVSSDREARCASWEVDQAEFLDLAAAREKLHPDQHPFLDRLLEHLEESPAA